MKVTIVASFFAKWNMNIDTGHKLFGEGIYADQHNAIEISRKCTFFANI